MQTGMTIDAALKVGTILIAFVSGIGGGMAAHYGAKDEMRAYTEDRVNRLDDSLVPKIDKILNLTIEQGKDIAKIKGVLGQQ